MIRVLVLLLSLSAIFAQTQQGSTRSEIAGGSQVKFVPLGDDKMKIVTTRDSTRSFFDSLQLHDLSATMRFIDKHSRFLFHSLIPDAGYYHGHRGFMKWFEQWFRVAAVTDASYEINYVDEGRGISVVTHTCSGVFRHNNVKFENIKVMIFIKWDLSKISKLNVVELNPHHIYSLFQTKAEQQWHMLISDMYRCGACEEVKKLLADDITISFKNVYPVSLFVNKTQLEQYQGKELEFKLKGIESAMKFIDFADKTYFNFTSDIRVLFSDNTTVVAVKILKPTPDLFIAPSYKSYWQSVTLMYTKNKFNDKGLLNEVTVMFNRPLLPHQIRAINQMFHKNGLQPLSSYIAPLMSAIQITPSQN